MRDRRIVTIQRRPSCRLNNCNNQVEIQAYRISNRMMDCGDKGGVNADVLIIIVQGNTNK